jgi:hypothetical protein
MDQTAEEPGFSSQHGQRFFSSPQHPHPLGSPLRLLLNDYFGFFHHRLSDWAVKLTTKFHLVLRLWMWGVISLLPMTWCILYYRDNFTCLFYAMIWPASWWHDMNTYLIFCLLPDQACQLVVHRPHAAPLSSNFILEMWNFIHELQYCFLETDCWVLDLINLLQLWKWYSIKASIRFYINKPEM